MDAITLYIILTAVVVTLIVWFVDKHSEPGNRKHH